MICVQKKERGSAIQNITRKQAEFSLKTRNRTMFYNTEHKEKKEDMIYGKQTLCSSGME